MEIKVALNHRMQYRYDKPVFLGPQIIPLRLAPDKIAYKYDAVSEERVKFSTNSLQRRVCSRQREFTPNSVILPEEEIDPSFTRTLDHRLPAFAEKPSLDSFGAAS